jgi:hypothetical protein
MILNKKQIDGYYNCCAQQLIMLNDQIICLKNTLCAVKTKLEHVLQIGSDYNLGCLDALNDFTAFLKLYARKNCQILAKKNSRY